MSPACDRAAQGTFVQEGDTAVEHQEETLVADTGAAKTQGTYGVTGEEHTDTLTALVFLLMVRAHVAGLPRET